MRYQLLIGNQNYSSWSLRPWLVLRAFDIPFTVQHLWLDTPEFAAEARSRTQLPAGRVPVLVDGEVRVWDSLAIIEYLAERHPGLWPADPVARAHARSAVAEMHSGFMALRSQMPMNVRRRWPLAQLRPEVQADVDRIAALWQEARSRFGAGGPYLYGAFSVADAFFAPVVFRCRTFAVKLPPVAQAYADTLLQHPAMIEWNAAAEAETAVVPHEEPEHLYGDAAKS